MHNSNYITDDSDKSLNYATRSLDLSTNELTEESKYIILTEQRLEKDIRVLRDEDIEYIASWIVDIIRNRLKIIEIQGGPKFILPARVAHYSTTRGVFTNSDKTQIADFLETHYKKAISTITVTGRWNLLYRVSQNYDQITNCMSAAGACLVGKQRTHIEVWIGTSRQKFFERLKNELFVRLNWTEDLSPIIQVERENTELTTWND